MLLRAAVDPRPAALICEVRHAERFELHAQVRPKLSTLEQISSEYASRTWRLHVYGAQKGRVWNASTKREHAPSPYLVVVAVRQEGVPQEIGRGNRSVSRPPPHFLDLRRAKGPGHACSKHTKININKEAEMLTQDGWGGRCCCCCHYESSPASVVPLFWFHRAHAI